MTTRRSAGRVAQLPAVALLAAGLLVGPAGVGGADGAADLPSPELISRTPAGRAPDAASFVGPMSADGRIVTYTSRATDIATVLTGGDQDRAFVVDRATGVTHLLATRPDGNPRSGASRPVAVSTGGRYVYYAYAYWGIAPDPHDARDGETLRYDTRTGAVVTVSELSLTPSGDGRYGVLVTRSPLVAADANTGFDAYRVDLTQGPTDQPVELLSRRPDGTASGLVLRPGLGSGLGISVSRDGQRVVFADRADLDPAIPHDPASGEVYLWDAATGSSRLLSVSRSGVAGDRTSRDPVISADGGVVAWTTAATDLGTGGGRVAWRDLDRATVHGLAPAGWAPASQGDPSLSRRGRYLTLRGVLQDGPPDQQVVRYDRSTGTAEVVADLPGSAVVSGTALSGDASTVTFGASLDGFAPVAVYAAPAGP